MTKKEKAEEEAEEAEDGGEDEEMKDQCAPTVCVASSAVLS